VRRWSAPQNSTIDPHQLRSRCRSFVGQSRRPFERGLALLDGAARLLDRLPRHDLMVGGEIADIFHMASESAVGAGEIHAALASARNS